MNMWPLQNAITTPLSSQVDPHEIVPPTHPPMAGDDPADDQPEPTIHPLAVAVDASAPTAEVAKLTLTVLQPAADPQQAVPQATTATQAKAQPALPSRVPTSTATSVPTASQVSSRPPWASSDPPRRAVSEKTVDVDKAMRKIQRQVGLDDGLKDAPLAQYLEGPSGSAGFRSAKSKTPTTFLQSMQHDSSSDDDNAAMNIDVSGVMQAIEAAIIPHSTSPSIPPVQHSTTSTPTPTVSKKSLSLSASAKPKSFSTKAAVDALMKVWKHDFIFDETLTRIEGADWNLNEGDISWDEVTSVGCKNKNMFLVYLDHRLLGLDAPVKSFDWVPVILREYHEFVSYFSFAL